MGQRGGIALIFLIVVLVAGLSIGVYLISQNTSWFSNAGSAQKTIPYASPSVNSFNENASTSADYENPFTETTTYENPFESF